MDAIIWILKNQPGQEHHGGRVLAGLRGRVVQRLLALSAAICTTGNSAHPSKLADRLRTTELPVPPGSTI